MDFDRYSQSYRSEVQKSLEGSGADSDLILEVKAEHFLKTLETHFSSLKNLSVLDVGCGIGLMDRYWSSSLPGLVGVDVSKESLAAAEKNNPQVKYVAYDGKHLPFADQTFDALVLVCVLHHIAPEQWEVFFLELKRTLKPNGLILIYEHNPYNPATQWIVSRCEFDDDAVLLRPGKIKSLAKRSGLQVRSLFSILFFPWRGKLFRIVENYIKWLPLGAQYVAVLKKENDHG